MQVSILTDNFVVKSSFGYFQYDLISVTSHRRQSYIFIDSVRAYKIPLMICKKTWLLESLPDLWNL